MASTIANEDYCVTDVCTNNVPQGRQHCDGCLYGKLLVVLDVDETLVHCEDATGDEDRTHDAIKPDFEIDSYHVFKRPFLDRFLELAFKHFFVGIWSAANHDYVHAIAARILQPTQVPEFIFTKEQTVVMKSYGGVTKIKPLEAISENLDFASVVMIDDNPLAFRHNQDNGIRIVPFNNPQQQQDDKALSEMLRLLQALKDVGDVREHCAQLQD